MILFTFIWQLDNQYINKKPIETETRTLYGISNRVKEISQIDLDFMHSVQSGFTLPNTLCKLNS